MATHTAIATTSKGHFDAIQVPTENPGQGQILLKVAYGAMIAFDTYVTDRGYAIQDYPMILGFSAAGTIHKVGPGINDLKVGDRVTSYTFGESHHKAIQEYALLTSNVCAKIPDSLSLEAAATIPDNFVTAFYTLFNQISLPLPASFPSSSAPPLANTTILIYGAGSTAGQYAVQLLGLAGYKNIIATASTRNHELLRSLGATSTFDYNSPTIVEDIQSAAGGDGKILLGLDCIAATVTLETIAKVISPLGTLAILLPVKEGKTVTGSMEEQMHMDFPEHMNPLPKSTKVVLVRTFLYQQDEVLRDTLMSKILFELLEKGLIKPARVRLMDQGSLKDRVALGLDLLRNNKISGEKVVVKIDA